MNTKSTKTALMIWLACAALVGVLVVSSLLVRLPLREIDRVRAAQSLVAWIVEGRRVPGLDEDYPDPKSLELERYYVVCTFVPEAQPLSTDSRVIRVPTEDAVSFSENVRFDGTFSYAMLSVSVRPSGRSKLVVDFGNGVGNLSGHFYEFEFVRTVWGLKGRYRSHAVA